MTGIKAEHYKGPHTSHCVEVAPREKKTVPGVGKSSFLCTEMRLKEGILTCHETSRNKAPSPLLNVVSPTPWKPLAHCRIQQRAL